MSMTHQIEAIAGLARTIGRPIRLMEVCGTHTMVGFRSGLRSLLPETVHLLSGPGCPVCVTPNRAIDRAIAMTSLPDVLVTTFGDMLRVPGTRSSLEQARADGGRVEIVYSPADALEKAARSPGTRVVFLGVGFETTVPAVAWTIRKAQQDGIGDYSVFCLHKSIPEAMEALLQIAGRRIDGFLCPGHVSTIIGSGAYEPLCRKHRIPCAVAGFEAEDMAVGIRMLLDQIANGTARVDIPYRRSVSPEGNLAARRAMEEVFEKCDADWRGLGVIPGSGFRIRSAFKQHDADVALGLPETPAAAEEPGCRCCEVLAGSVIPPDCRLFGKQCTPADPVGPCMVSSEGTCAAYLKYGKYPDLRRNSVDEERYADCSNLNTET